MINVISKVFLNLIFDILFKNCYVIIEVRNQFYTFSH